MLRKETGKKPEDYNKDFRFRSHEVMRIEAFSDAVFALAVTLLIVSLEVPKSFDELMITMRGFFAFGISFLLLMMIWYEQNIFFRRYGLNDVKTIALNCVLVFLVLFYVYPLKFLFTLIFSRQIYGDHSPYVMKADDASQLMFIYGIGYVLIYSLFLLMYIHALKKKRQLELTMLEEFDTKTKLFLNIILISIGMISIITSQLVNPSAAGDAGMVYILIGPALTIYYSLRKRKRRKLVNEISLQKNV